MPGDAAEDDGRQRTRDQIALVASARDGRIGWDSTDEADFSFLFDPDVVLVREGPDVEALREAIDRRKDVFEGLGDVVGSNVPGLTRYLLPVRRDTQTRDVLPSLEILDAELGPGVATPEHFIHITSAASCCPATEPAESGLPGPWPERSSSGGAGVRVVVIDTGLHEPATSHPASPWLAGVTGTAEPFGPILAPYTGHGTFAAGVLRCRAPEAEVDVRRFTVDASGAIAETQVAELLSEVLAQEQPPHVISISAGTYTRLHLPLLSFDVLWENVLKKLPETVVVAAAGNDSRAAPFWPAAFDWAVGVGSLDRDGAISSYSNYCRSADVYALGRNHVNAFPVGRYVCHETPDRGDEREFTTGLARWSGTSFATPLVAGLIAAATVPFGGSPVSPDQARDQILAAAVDGHDAIRGPYRALLPPF